MLNKTLWITLFLSIPVLLFAQNAHYQKGYVIKNNGDTLVGYLQRLNDIDLSKGVNFKEALTDDPETVFSPTDLRGFYFEENEIKFESLRITLNFTDKIKTVQRFAPLMLSGYCSLYMLSLDGNEKPTFYEPGCIYIAKKGDRSMQLSETEKLDGSQYSLTKNYLDSLAILFRDCKAISYETIFNANFSPSGMIRLFTLYNNCINPGVKTSVRNYQSPTQIREGVEASYVEYPGGGFIGEPSGFSVGYFMDFLNPSISENFSFMIDLNYLRVTGQEASYPVPVQPFTDNIIRFHFLSTLNLADKRTVIPFINFGGTVMYDNNSENSGNFKVYMSAGAGCFIGKKIMAAFLLDNLILSNSSQRFSTLRIGYRLK